MQNRQNNGRVVKENIICINCGQADRTTVISLAALYFTQCIVFYVFLTVNLCNTVYMIRPGLVNVV